MNDFFYCGKLEKNLIKEDYKNLKYINKKFNDDKTIENWKRLGHDYKKYTGFMRDQTNFIPDWCFKISEQIPLKNSTITLYYIPPGVIMPEHSDTFEVYRKIMNIDSSKSIGRAVVFLEDWKSGHYFEINENPVVNWKSGDYVLWKNDIPHLAANLGKEKRYTMQITGII